MPVSIVVGGQYGSEGKGKVAHYLAASRNASAVVRVGGPNSGHSVIDQRGKLRVFRQLPTAAILEDPTCVISAGSYIDLEILRREIDACGLRPERLKIDPKAVVITQAAKAREQSLSLRSRIGSTLSGTGAAVSQRVNRSADITFISQISDFATYLCDTTTYLADLVDAGHRVILEGSQGFGLSAIHSPHFPYATSRDTTAAGVLSEVGLSPLHVDEIVLVIRTFPIRVPGNSGPLLDEISWDEVTRISGSKTPIMEMTSVTQSKRRVGTFDPGIVRRAIRINSPTIIVLNHVDYVDSACRELRTLTPRALQHVRQIESSISGPIDLVGTGPDAIVRSNEQLRVITAK